MKAAAPASDDDITRAYRVLSKSGSYEDKKLVIGIFRDNYKNERILDMTIDLLTHGYEDVNFKENDQSMYYDDVIAEELVKLLGRNGNKKAFPALLRVALNSKSHRDQTVKEAWKAIQLIQW